MEVEYKLTPSDYGAFQRYHHRKGPGIFHGRVPRYIFYSMHLCTNALVLALLVAILVSQSGFLAGVLLGFFAGTIITVVDLTIRQHFLLKNPGFYNQTVLSLLPQGIRAKTPFSEGLTNWAGIVAVGVTKNRIYIYISTAHAHIVPRRAFSDDRTFDAFIDCVFDYLDSDNPTRFRDQRPVSSENVKRATNMWKESGPSGREGPAQPPDSETQSS